jgi:hypothetical protein
MLMITPSEKITPSEVHTDLHAMREVLEDACSILSEYGDLSLIPAELDRVIDTALTLRGRIREVVPFQENF